MASSQTTDWLSEKGQAVADAETEVFSELVKLAGLDPAQALRFANFSGVDFAGSNLQGFDFTGARLIGCNFHGASIAGARFDQAEIDEAKSFPKQGVDWGNNPETDRVGSDAKQRTNLRLSADWNAYLRGWRKPERFIGDGHLPVGAVFQDAPFGPEMVVVPPGEFLMGTPDGLERVESPQHSVLISQAFAVGRYAVSFEEWDFAQSDNEWEEIAGLMPRKADDEGWGRGRRPVIDVSWEDAQAYAKWLTAKTGRAYHLLSEAEWEYAARAGTTTPFWWGSSITPDRRIIMEIMSMKAVGRKANFGEGLCRWMSSRLTPLGFIRFTAMFGSGWRIAGTTVTKARRAMVPLG